MKNVCLILFVIVMMSSCQKDESVSSQCYADNPVDELAWFNAAVKPFQQPKSGPLIVASYKFKGEAYLVISNPAVSSPAGYIYNCSGQSISQLGIRYNTFTKEAKLMEVFIDDKY